MPALWRATLSNRKEAIMINFRLKYELYDPHWIESAAGNHVCIDGDDIVCTVYKNSYSDIWQIVVNDDGEGYFVQDEFFFNHCDAIERAEEILNGSKCYANKAKPKPYGFP